jgi:hypothetical protein
MSAHKKYLKNIQKAQLQIELLLKDQIVFIIPVLETLAKPQSPGNWTRLK